MDPIVEEEIMKKHNQADAFISLFFAGLDVVCYIIILTLFGCDFKNISSPKQKLSSLIVLDAVLRIFNMYSDEYSKYFIKEIFFTCFTTVQFTIIIALLNQIFEKSGESFDTDIKIGNQRFLTSIFFVLVFSFKGIFESYKLLSALQFICIMICLFIMSKFIGGKIETYLSNITKKDASFSGENFINNMPFFISLYFIINYLFEIISLFVEQKLYASYMTMLCKIFKEVGKYLVFFLLIILYYTYNKYLSDEFYDYAGTAPASNSSGKGSVTVYKDEDEYDDV